MGAVRPSIPTGKFVILNRINTKGETGLTPRDTGQSTDCFSLLGI